MNTRLPFLAGRLALALASVLASGLTAAGPVHFSTGGADGRMAMASRPDANGPEVEAADDFVTTAPTRFTHATVTGLLTGGAGLSAITQVDAEIYRVFPKDSNLVRTPQVPTRVNSPSDVALLGRSSGDSSLHYTVTLLNDDFTAANSVQVGGIHASPNQRTGGNGAVTGLEVLIDLFFDTPIDLDVDHFFFVPQVAVTGGEFLWLSSSRPMGPGGTPFAPDLQAWIRDGALDPDWLRVGTDIVGAGTFNAAFSLDGESVPEPGTLALAALACATLGSRRSRGVRARRGPAA